MNAAWTSTDHSDFPLDWNGPTDRPFEPFAAESKARPIVALLERVVRRFPQRIALLDREGSVTYAELWRRVNVLAEQIAHATQPGELVGVLAPVGPQFPIAIVGCLAAGRAFVVLDPTYPREWIAQVLEDSRAALLLTTGQSIGVRTLNLDTVSGEASASWRPAHLGPDEPACILFTSGSTGKPKGIVNSQRNLLQRVSQSINAGHVNSEDRFLTLTSLCTIVGIRDLLTSLLAGAAFYLIDTQNTGTREIHEVILECQISILFAFPALLRSVVASSQGRAGDFLRLVRVGGDTTLWSDIAALRAWMATNTFIQVVYAATEAPMMQWFVGDCPPETEDRVPIGYPLPGNGLMVVGDELIVRSVYVALGTWSQGRFRAGYETSDGRVREFRTGDLVRQRPDGLYDRLGRKDRQVKIRGARVELDGVETAIRRHPSVRDVGVIVRSEGESGLARLVAYVQPDEAASDQFMRELSLMMRRVVPAHMRPWRYYRVPVIPRLPNSKLDGRALLDIDAAKCREEATDTDLGWVGTNPLEMTVARIWRDRLGLRLSCAEDDFFELGGDSLRAITMTFDLERALQRNLPTNLISQAPTFVAFCAALEETAPVGYRPLVTLKEGEGTALFFIHGAGGSVMELFTLCRKMSWPGPVIGIQARGLDGRDRPHGSVEEMADEYLAAIRHQQPHGPYFLCGYSFGGLVAFELARRLSKEVAFVGLVATLPPGHHWLRLWTWTGYLYRQLTRSAGRRTQRTPAALRAIALKALMASAVYRADNYDGQLTVFEPARRDLGAPSTAALWRRHASIFKHENLQARHDDMLEGANAQRVADLLTRCLESAAARRNSTSD